MASSSVHLTPPGFLRAGPAPPCLPQAAALPTPASLPPAQEASVPQKQEPPQPLPKAGPCGPARGCSHPPGERGPGAVSVLLAPLRCSGAQADAWLQRSLASPDTGRPVGPGASSCCFAPGEKIRASRQAPGVARAGRGSPGLSVTRAPSPTSPTRPLQPPLLHCLAVLNLCAGLPL